MLHHLIESPKHMSLEDCLADREPGETRNYQYDDSAFFEEPINTTNAPYTANNNIASAPEPTTKKTAPAATTETTPANQIAATLPYYDPCFTSSYSPYDASNILSIFLNPQQPTEPEPDILPPLPMLHMPPTTYPTNQLNPMISSTAFTSYPPDPMAHQLPVDLSGCLGYEPSMMQPCPFLGANSGEFYGDGMGLPTCGADGDLGFLAGAGMAVPPPETLEACGYGIYGPGSMLYGQGDLQVLGDNQHLMVGGGGGTAPLQVPSNISTLNESNYKIGRQTGEERKVSIGRYLMKKSHRNFNRKIKYECRKTLADSRPRVRGRFAKNEDLRDAARNPSLVNHDGVEVATTNEKEMLQSSEILQSSKMLVHLSGMNSFKYNYSLEFRM